MDWLSWIFDTSAYPARWHCGLWNEWVGWTYILSDIVTFLAYCAIPLIIAFYVFRRKDVNFTAIYWLFCAFIFACGTTHLIDAIIFWHPVYNLSAVAKGLTAIVSTATAGALIMVLPKALELPGLPAINRRLQDEIEARARSEQDLAERHERLQLAEARLHEAQRIAEIGDWSYDLTSDTITWSPQVFALFERDPSAGPPSGIEANRSLYPQASQEALDQAVARAIDGGQEQEVDLQVALPSGRTVWHRGTIRPVIVDGQVVELRGTVQDITKSKEVALDLERTSRELATVNNELERFTLTASHELQEPLRKIAFFAEQLLACESDDGPSHQYAERIEMAAQRLQSQVQGLLQLARLGTACLPDPQPVAVATIIDRSHQEVAPDLELRNDLDPTLTVAGDSELLQRLFDNLLSNAMRYRHPERQPSVHVIGVVRGDILSIEVADNGIGLPPGSEQLVFRPLQRCHPREQSTGIGIGLAICQRIAQAHRGDIIAQRYEHGTSFVVSLPLHRSTT